MVLRKRRFKEVQQFCKRVAIKTTTTKGLLALKLFLRPLNRKSRPHRCFSQIHLEPPSHLLPPEGDHRKRENIAKSKHKHARVS